ncbi:ABC transporter ATP-binding protein [candidate division CSSED10-310 bacterium]|uniref:ABC transporter ATP-binding protein n=1 Tax=candidate division CSSED10-310 bacterium TaxID=2855610 RepID=A0ABV6YWA9_UNCC1
MSLVAVNNIYKTFNIPKVRRDTVREQLFRLGYSRAVERLKVLQGVSFQLERGEALGIMGPNGSGKSTLLKIVCGIYLPDQGSVIVQAPITPILELGIGWNPELDAVDNALLTATAMGVSLIDAKSKIAEILAFAELEKFAQLQLKFYSSGMSARLAYATAFCSVREILIIDEIFAVGDAHFVKKCEQKYRYLLDKGHTMILVSHHPDVIENFCSRALLLDNGQILLDASAAEVAAEYSRRMG